MEFLNPPRVLDLDDRQGLIASSAMQLKKNIKKHGYDNAAASSTDANPKWRNWDEDYAMGYQLHP